MPLFVQFGAGNIGRSFLGRQFSEAGFEVTFVDVDQRLVALLNERGSYRVVVKDLDKPDETKTVSPVSALLGTDLEGIIDAVVRADFVATSVGLRALDSVLPVLARGLIARAKAGRPDLDVIIAENLRSGAQLYHEKLRSLLGDQVSVLDHLGLVETSIGKMVPLMPAAGLAEDPLQLFAEPYDTLIVDRKGFHQALPPLKGLKAVENVTAYVDRKLFMHNMSHAAAAYFGYVAEPAAKYLWQVMENQAVVSRVRLCLDESAAALACVYPQEFNGAELQQHGYDLLARYRNRALGDTLHRVGRDLGRKLARDDRLIGACLLAAEAGLPYHHLAAAAAAALVFRAPDEQGQMLPADAQFVARLGSEGSRALLLATSMLDPTKPHEAAVLETILLGTEMLR